jgi:hypothetical protein
MFILGLYLTTYFDVIVLDLLQRVPDFSDFVFEDFNESNKNCETASATMRKLWSRRPSCTTRASALMALFKCEGHRARHQFLYLLAPIWRLYANQDHAPEEMVLHSVKLLVETSSSVDGFLSSGFSANRCAAAILDPNAAQRKFGFQFCARVDALAVFTAGLVCENKAYT